LGSGRVRQTGSGPPGLDRSRGDHARAAHCRADHPACRPSGSASTAPPRGGARSGRLALAGAGHAFLGFRGLPEVRVAKVAPVLLRRSRHAVSAAFRSSLSHRRPRTVARDRASLSLARPFKAHSRRSTPARCWHAGHRPPGLPSPTAFEEQRVRYPRALPGPPPSVLSVSHALDGFHPATPSGLISSR
jgi:hypothetical protein